MGKCTLGCLLAVALFLLAGVPTTAQDPVTDEHGYVPGQFFTPADYEHMVAALAYLDLTPADLSYEKKHIDHKFRLSAANRGLDQPLSVPGITEEAARELGTSAEARQRLAHAEMLLDQAPRITDAELALDDADYRRHHEQTADLEKKEGREAAIAARHELRCQEVIGGDPREAHDLGGLQSFVDGTQRFLSRENKRSIRREFEAIVERLYHPVRALNRVPSGLTADDVNALRRLPMETVDAEVSVPGSGAPSGDLLLAGQKVPITACMAAAYWLKDVLSQLVPALQEMLRKGQPDEYLGFLSEVDGVTGGIIGAWQGPWGKIVLGGTGPNTYQGDDFIAIIDVGGDDTYRGRVAAGIGSPGHAPVSCVLDLSGDDTYAGDDFTQGFGFLGVGILWDLGGGSDDYRCGFCGQGCGMAGYGELYDDGGDDSYRSDSGSQGAASFGMGHLIDKGGNDSYRGARFVQAFAQVMGLGVLSDADGNDLYFAGGKYLHLPLWNDRHQSLSQGFAIGNRYLGTGGGIALLLDEGNGNDVYHADIYGQGSSYWYSLGMLVDCGGNDTYTVGQYGQGAGIHLSTGILVDLSGNDTYAMGVGLGQGAAHDWAVGWLIDRAGNDMYQGNGQGMGLNFSFAVLLDCAGDDSHSTNNDGSIGKGSNNDISLLLDLGGYDVYGPKEIKDSTLTRRAKRALVYDVPEGWFPGIDTSTLPTPQEPAPAKTRVQHILIAWDGSGVNTQKAPRTQAQAKALMLEVLKSARSKDADWKALQVAYNEDCAKSPDHDNTHNTYDAAPGARLVKPFLDLSLKLGVGQIDWCESKFGYHIIKRVE